MEKMIKCNNKAWSILSKDHYNHFSKKLKDGTHKLSKIILDELKTIDLHGKKLLHLQCNTGADSILLSKMGADVTGVDLSESNIHYARLLAKENNEDITFIESNVLTLKEIHHKKYDIVFTSEGVLFWLPDYDLWAQNIRYFLKEDGFFYINEVHPFYGIFDEDVINKGELVIKYPYFDEGYLEEDTIGGYASSVKKARTYERSYTVGIIINALSKVGIYVDSFNEYDRCVFGMGSHNAQDADGLVYIKELEGKLPMTFSIMASIK